MRKNTDLNGKWLCFPDKDETGEKLRFFDISADTSSWREMEIPSNWQVAGLNDYSGVVWFRKEFQVPSAKYQENNTYFLRFKGIDYFADVWLNGKKLGSHEGYFQPFEFDVTDIIKEGKNILVVRVNSPKEGKNWPHNKRIIKGVFGHHDLRPGAWSPELGQSLGTGGIWNNVELIVANEVLIKDVKVAPKLKKNEAKVEVKVEVKAYSTVDISSEVKIIETKKGQKKKVTLKKGINFIKFQLPIRNPKLWWCWDQGEPNLYTLEAEIGEFDKQTVRFGLREIKVDKNLNWYLNGRRIFIRGTNIIPEEYLSTYTKERIEKDLKLAREANVNALRVHAHVNRKEFYEACDEAGILVWQDFALQWEYDNSKEFIDNAKRQIKDMVNLLYNHPSIIIWCCHNEPLKSRKKMDPLLYKEVKKLDQSRVIFQSSNFAEHPYPGWFMGKMEYFKSLPAKPFVTEFGAQALPCLGTLKKMFKENELWPPNWKEYAFRCFTYEQYFNIAGEETGSSIEEFIEKSQDYQSKLLKFSIETYRRHKFSEITGLFHFMLNDPWPCISYSVLDYFRLPKKGFETLKKAYQPVLLIYEPERSILSIGDKIRGTFYLVNDLPKKLKNCRVKICLQGKEDKVNLAEFKLDIELNSCKEVTNQVYSLGNSLPIPEGLTEGDYILVFSIYDDSNALLSRNDYAIQLKNLPEGIADFGAVFEW